MLRYRGLKNNWNLVLKVSCTTPGRALWRDWPDGGMTLWFGVKGVSEVEGKYGR